MQFLTEVEILRATQTVWSVEFKKGFASSTFECHYLGLLVLSTFTESTTKYELRTSEGHASIRLSCTAHSVCFYPLSERVLGPLCQKLWNYLLYGKKRKNKTSVKFPVTPFKQEDADITYLVCILNLHLQEFSNPYRFIVAIFYILSFFPFVSCFVVS